MSGRRTGLTVVIVTDLRLLGESLRVALAGRGIRGTLTPLPSTRSQREEFLDLMSRLRPRAGLLLLLDTTEAQVVARATALVEAVPLPWLLLTSTADPRRWGVLLQAGVTGVLPLNSTVHQLSDGILTMASGRALMPKEARDTTVRRWLEELADKEDVIDRLFTLSPRESAVLDSLAHGQTVRTIADAHGVSEGTVRSQVKSILHKLGVNTQLAAVAIYRDARPTQTRSPGAPSVRRQSRAVGEPGLPAKGAT